MNVATPELIRALIQANENALARLGADPPRDPDRAKDWNERRARLLAELEGFRKIKGRAEARPI